MLIPKPVGMDFAISPKTGQRKTWLPRLLPEKLDAAKSGPKKVESAIEKVESAIEKVESASQKSGIRKPKKWNPHCGFQKNALRTASAPLKKVESAPRKVKSATKKAKAARENLEAAAETWPRAPVAVPVEATGKMVQYPLEGGRS